MQKVILFSIMLLFSGLTYSQESFKKSLEKISTDLCSKMEEKGKKKVVVLFVTDINKAQTTAGKYMADVVSFYIVNSQIGFSVFDRENLSGIAEAKKLIAEGYIDANNAKQLGKILSVEAIVVGNYTVLSSSLSLTLKALDVNDGFVIAQSLNDLPIDKDAAALLGISTVGGSQNISNLGFDNKPLNSNEIYNNPETVDKDCEKYIFGDYCFENNTKYDVKVHLGKGTNKASRKFDGQNNPMYKDPEPYSTRKISLAIESGQKQCVFELKPGPCEYEIYIIYDAKNYKGKVLKGEILVEKCKSKTFVIK